MPRPVPVIYRIRATWRAGSWIVRSPDAEGLVLHEPRLCVVAERTRSAIAQLYGIAPRSFDVVVQHIGFDDPRLREMAERSIALRAFANESAREASEVTLATAHALAADGMDLVDVEEALGMPGHWSLGRRRDGVYPALFDEPPWFEPYDDSDDWGYDVDPWKPWFSCDTPSATRRLLNALGDEVGGATELAVLRDDPLPDESFECDVPSDIVGAVAEVASLCDEVCEKVFDAEARTACRRLLAALVDRGPQYFRRRRPVNAARTAAALCWIVGKANHLFSHTESPRIKDVADALGVTTPSAGAEAVMRALGFDEWWGGRVVLGSPDFLVAAHRRRIIDMRDAYAAASTSDV